ncbi:hypothetical protein Tco_1048912 [Tanacetum coccineum]
MIEGTKKQQTYKLIIRSIDVNAARYVLVLPMAVNTASLIFKGRLVLPVHVNAAITKGCECDLTIKLQKKREEEKVHQSLMGLDVKAYGTLRSNVQNKLLLDLRQKITLLLFPSVTEHVTLQKVVSRSLVIKNGGVIDLRRPDAKLEKVEEDLKVLVMKVEDRTWVLGLMPHVGVTCHTPK